MPVPGSHAKPPVARNTATVAAFKLNTVPVSCRTKLRALSTTSNFRAFRISPWPSRLVVSTSFNRISHPVSNITENNRAAAIGSEGHLGKAPIGRCTAACAWLGADIGARLGEVAGLVVVPLVPSRRRHLIKPPALIMHRAPKCLILSV